MNSRLPSSLTLSFTGFSQRGGCTDHHADGWGIAFFESDGAQPGKGVRYFVDKQSAATSPIAQMLRTFPIKSHNVVAHVRKATVGHVTLENSHPFVRELWGRYWVFAHNGDLKDYAPPLHGSFRPVGDTDSELAFCWLLQELAKSHAGVPSVHELTLTLRELVPADRPPWHIQLPAQQRPGPVGPCQHQSALPGAPAPVPGSASARRGHQGRSGRTQRPGGPAGHRGDRAADDQRELDRISAGELVTFVDGSPVTVAPVPHRALATAA
jgi:hypothetical protein